LDDLTEACIDAAHETGADAPIKFEVGVFCESYITPVRNGYFEHLERLRGEGRKLKAMEKTRKAVAHGVAAKEQIEMATQGLTVTKDGQIVAATNGRSDVPLNMSATDKEQWLPEEEQSPTLSDRIDISLHNFGDYPR